MLQHSIYLYKTQATMINDYLEQKEESKNLYLKIKLNPRCNYSQCKEQINGATFPHWGLFSLF